ncbi:MAG: gliding motility-associated C-terminal domain-containing protein [Bacteroidota bacterium]
MLNFKKVWAFFFCGSGMLLSAQNYDVHEKGNSKEAATLVESLPQEQLSPADALQPFNMITPNGDGINDTWQIGNIESLRDTFYNIKVFTKAGQIVFESKDYVQEWDGSYQGEALLSGTYYYHISVTDNKGVSQKTGIITLMR